MNRPTVALLSALDAVIAVAIGVGIPLVPLTIMWASSFHLAVDWGVFWRASVDSWLLGHGVDLTVALDAPTSTALGLPGASTPFPVTIAALGIAVVAVLLGARTGRRAAATPFRATGAVTAVVVYGVLGMVVTISALSGVVTPSLWQGIVLPAFVFALGIVVGLLGAALRDYDDAPDDAKRAMVRAPFDRVTSATRLVFASAARGGAAAAGMLLAAAAVVVAVLIAIDYAPIIAVYEGVHAGVTGSIVLTLAQLALLPNAVIWAASWLAGPGFAIGTGSTVDPTGSALGPLPDVPLFALVPHGDLAAGFVGLVVPIAAGFVAARLVRARLTRMPRLMPGGGRLFVIALGMGVVAGVVLGLLAWWSSGSIGPGRLHDAGPNGWLVGVFVALEVAIAATVGILTRSGPSTRR